MPENSCVNCANELTCGYSMLATDGRRDDRFSYGPCVLGMMSGGKPFFVAKVAVSKEILEKLEWITDEFTGVTGGRCRICGGYKYDRRLHPGEFAGHASNCELGNALAAV